jgi:hypothetical protein
VDCMGGYEYEGKGEEANHFTISILNS